MLTANRLKAGFGKLHFGVTANGEPVGTIDDGSSTFDVQGEKFFVARNGVFEITVTLKSGEKEILTAIRQPLRNYYKLTIGGKDMTYKATNMAATKFGLFEGERQTGTVSSGTWPNRTTGITADLPEELPREVQMFLLRIYIGSLLSD